MKRLPLVLLAASALLSLGRPAQAIPLLDLLDGSVLTVGDKLFFDWQLIDLVVSDPASDPDLSLIEVIALEDEPLNPGFRLEANGQLIVRDQEFLDLHFGFSVAVLDPRFAIKDNSLELVAFEFGGGGGVIAIAERVFDSSGGPLLADKLVQADNRLGIFELLDVAAFPPRDVIVVEKNILLAGDFVGDVVQLDVFEDRISQISEPSALILLSASLIGVLRHRRTRDRRGQPLPPRESGRGVNRPVSSECRVQIAVACRSRSNEQRLSA